MLLLHVDIETTGLDKENDEILEIAWVITDSRLAQLWRPRSFLIYSDDWPKTVSKIRSDSTVEKMHYESRLLDDLYKVTRRDAVRLKVVDLWMSDDIARVRSVSGPNDQAVYLAGNSVQFDRAFIERDLPNTADLLHYRNYDVTTLMTFVDSLDIPVSLPEFKGTKHRALDDIKYSLEVARAYRKLALQAKDMFR